MYYSRVLLHKHRSVHWLCARPRVPKLWTSIFLMYFGVLNLDSGNQIWKFRYRYFGKFSEFEFNKYHIFWTLDFYRIKIGLSLKSLGTIGLDADYIYPKCTLGRVNLFYDVPKVKNYIFDMI